MRLIDAEAFVQTEIDRCGCIPFVGTGTMNNEFLPVRVMKAPTIEAKPVVHAHWEKVSEYMPIYRCSDCKERNLFKNGNNVFSNYCPYCGAQMDFSEEKDE